MTCLGRQALSRPRARMSTSGYRLHDVVIRVPDVGCSLEGGSQAMYWRETASLLLPQPAAFRSFLYMLIACHVSVSLSVHRHVYGAQPEQPRAYVHNEGIHKHTHMHECLPTYLPYPASWLASQAGRPTQYIRTYIQTYIHTYTHMRIFKMSIYTHTEIHPSIHTCVHKFIIHAYIITCIHTGCHIRRNALHIIFRGTTSHLKHVAEIDGGQVTEFARMSLTKQIL